MIKPNELSIRIKLIDNGQAELVYSENLSHYPPKIRKLTAGIVAKYLSADQWDFDGKTFKITLVGPENKIILTALSELLGMIPTKMSRAFIDYLENKGFIPFISIEQAQKIIATATSLEGKIEDYLSQMPDDSPEGKLAKNILEQLIADGMVKPDDPVSELTKIFKDEKEGGQDDEK